MPLQRPSRTAAERPPGALEGGAELVEVGDDEPGGGRRSRGSHVGGQVAERRVLLVTDGADDRHGAAGDGTDDALVAERQQVLEAAAAAREDDHVDLRLGADRPQRLGDRGSRARPLDERLRDEQPGGREARLDGGDHVPLGGSVVSGHEPDPPRHPRQRPLPLRCEEPLGGELLLQPLERRQMLAEPEALDSERAEPQLTLRLEQLRPAVDVDALAAREIELQRVELPAGHQPGQERAVAGILEREEDALPALLAAQLGDLALHPDRRQPLQPGAHPTVERGHGVHPPVAVVDRLDLAHASQSSGSAVVVRGLGAGRDAADAGSAGVGLNRRSRRFLGKGAHGGNRPFPPC